MFRTDSGCYKMFQFWGGVMYWSEEWFWCFDF